MKRHYITRPFDAVVERVNERRLALTAPAYSWMAGALADTMEAERTKDKNKIAAAHEAEMETHRLYEKEWEMVASWAEGALRHLGVPA